MTAFTARSAVLALLGLLGAASSAPAQSSEDTAALQRGLQALLGGQLAQVEQQIKEQPPVQAAPAAAVAHAAGPSDTSGFIAGPNNTLEFHARNLSVADAFAQLRQLVRMNIVVSPDVNASFTGDLYALTPQQIIEAICRTTNLVARVEESFIFIEPDKADTRIYELSNVRAEDLVELVRPLLSPMGQVSATVAPKQGIKSSQEGAGGDDYAWSDTLVVHDFSTNLEAVDRLISTVDHQPVQVLVEATILSVELNDRLAMGIDISAFGGAGFEDGLITSVDGQSLTFDGTGFSGALLDEGLKSTATDLLSTFPKGGLSVAILRDGIGAFVRALQTVTDTTVLANPKIITLNKQRGEVLLGRRDGFRVTTVTQTSTTESIEFLETGTRLVYRPFISGEYVRLEIHPEDSDGGIDETGLPFKETTEITTNVMVRDGETVVIGGLFREKDKSINKKVPLLGDLPLIGYLFRSEDHESVREEIVILLTPHIIDAAGRPRGAPPNTVTPSAGGWGNLAAGPSGYSSSGQPLISQAPFARAQPQAGYGAVNPGAAAYPQGGFDRGGRPVAPIQPATSFDDVFGGVTSTGPRLRPRDTPTSNTYGGINTYGGANTYGGSNPYGRFGVDGGGASVVMQPPGSNGTTAAQRPGPGLAPDGLTAAYIETARELLAEGRYASAGVMLDSLPWAERQRPEVRTLRNQSWRGLIGDTPRSAVDDEILSMVLNAPPQGPGP